MADYAAASRTKDHFQAQLLLEHPEIVSIAPRLKLDDQGRPTQEAVIVIGVKTINPLRFGAGARARPQAAGIPSRLPLFTVQGVEDKTRFVDVIVEQEGNVILESFAAKRRPCPGGYSIGHPSVTVGTLGGVARSGPAWGYVLSNNHVLAAQNSAAVGDPIYQPCVHDGGTAAETVANLERWVPVNVVGGNNEVNCALAKAVVPWNQNVSRQVEGIGTPAAEDDATVGQAIRKSGRTTQVTTGAVLSDNATLRLPYGGGSAVFINQLQYTRMTQGGDSGSLLWDQKSLTVVGLHFAGSSTASYGNKIGRVLSLLSQEQTVFDARGRPTTLPATDVGLTDQP